MASNADLGIVLLAHGSRRGSWNDSVRGMADGLAEDFPGAEIVFAYLQFAKPDLKTALEELLAAGRKRIAVLPIFLGAGGHILQDVPEVVESVRSNFPGTDIQVSAALGTEPEVIEGLRAAGKRLIG
jgi:sirohydrochlorin cobaltochelatase